MYKKGTDMVVPDALSRSLENFEEGGEIHNIEEEKVLKIHENVGHRKGIKKELQAEKILLNNNQIRKILRGCESCQRKDPNNYKVKGFVRTTFPGEKVGVDIMEISPKEKIIMAIDYFTRYLFAKVLNSKESTKVLEFMQQVNKKLKIITLIADNGKEFNNKELKKWAAENKINLNYSVPYFYESNGRIERANRKIRDALKRTKGM